MRRILLLGVLLPSLGLLALSGCAGRSAPPPPSDRIAISAAPVGGVSQAPLPASPAAPHVP